MGTGPDRTVPIAAPEKGLLRFLTCGSVDDGKSTLLGRLLHDTQTLFEDHLSALRRDAARHGTVPGGIDFALLLDGLEAEREQGITIDVAYRFFRTGTRAFIAADTPGHEQYTRNMATGASTAELAIALVDAAKGLLPQTRRHSFIASLLGIRQIVLAVNKIDLVGYDESVFRRIEHAYREFAAPLGFEAVTTIPLSARHGDNVVARGEAMDWYDGPTLLDALEAADTRTIDPTAPLRLPVQWVNRPDAEFRGYCGTISSGRVDVGDTVRVATSGATSRVRRLIASGRDVDAAKAGDAVTVVLEKEIDVSRGDLISAEARAPLLSNQFAAHLIWMNPELLVPGRTYHLRIGTRTVLGSVTEIKHAVDVERFQHLATKSLALNEIALVNVSLREPVAFDTYRDNRDTGAFIVIDRVTNQTLGAGVIEFELRRATNIRWQPTDVDKNARARALGQKPVALWFTGLSGAGKSTIANLLEKRLFALGHHTYLLDGDNVRHGLNRDLGFTEADRVENIRRVAETARLFVDAGLITLVSLISPYRSERRMARELFEPGEFLEIFVDAPIAVAEARDPKGLYLKARQGLIRNFTGIDSPYQPPENPDLHLRTAEADPAALVEEILQRLEALGLVSHID